MDRETARTLLDESRRHMDATLRAVADLDHKAIELVKMDGVGLGLTATATSLLSGASRTTLRPAPAAAGLLGVACLLASMALAVVALYHRDVALGVIDLAEGLDLRYSETLGFTLEIHKAAVEANRAAADAKGRLIAWGSAALLAAAVLLGGAAVGFMLMEVMKTL